MIKLSTRIACATAFIGAAFAAEAIPAKPQPFNFTQPDGTIITVTLRGDERAHCYLSDDGCILLNQDNGLYYAKLDADGKVAPSAVLAQNAAQRSSQAKQLLANIDQEQLGEALKAQAVASNRGPKAKSATMKSPAKIDGEEEVNVNPNYGLFPGNHFPAYGERKGIVVLVEYQDVAFSLEDPKEYFSRLLNEEGWSEDYGTGSARDYFIASSNGRFMPTFDVYGPITLPNNRAYYGGNDSWGNDKNPEKMAIHACDILDDEVDFTQYDTDGDGFIDMVYLIYAGLGEADGGGASTVWPHSWDISSATAEIYEYDGVRLDHYACGNEIQLGGLPDGIGTFTHEFSHVLGLPDLYATNYTNAFHPGDYSILASGCYNNDSRTPPAYSIFERTALGWMDVDVLSEPGEYLLEDINVSNHGYKLPTSKDTEYFLFENRQKDGWDKYIPGHGMLVWHIDYNENAWTYNTVNNTPSHQYVDIEEADNIKNEATRNGDTFPGASNVTKISDYTAPNLTTWNNEYTNFPISLITETDGVISFYGGPRPDFKPETPVANEAQDITYTSFSASWEEVPEVDYYVLNVADAYGVALTEWEDKKITNRTKADVKDLAPSSTYTYWVYAVCDGVSGDASNVVEVTTPIAPLDFYTISALEATDITPNSFVANWEGLDQVQDYVINVTEMGLVGNPMFTVDFTGGIKDMPDGWTTTTSLIYSKGENCGAAPPALRFASSGNVTSCTYDNEILTISFWYKGISVSEENVIDVQVTNGSAWTTIATFVPNNDEGLTATVNDVPEGYTRMRLLYVENKHSGSVSIDDIVVTTSGFAEAEGPLDGYYNRSMGTELSCKVEGLKPSTEYRYTVTATDGELWAKTSTKIYVTTSSDAGINAVSVDRDLIQVEGNTVISAGAYAYTIDGKLVGVGPSITLSPGIYIIRVGGAVQKVIIE